ncbi:MAG: hypothetical protein ABSC94_01080 [Polyangiaceae bacterium]
MPSLIAATSLRVDRAGVPDVDGLSFASGGSWVLVLGAGRALFEAAAGLRPAQRGELRIDGAAPAEALSLGFVASAPLDPPMPPAWLPRQYVTWSARVSGHPRRVANDLASDALDRLELAASAQIRLSKAPLAMRRATVLAAALATGATTLLIENPLVDLPPAGRRPFARVVARALTDRRVVVFGGRLPFESPLVFAADEAIVIDGSQVAAQGAPAEIVARERAFVLRVTGDVPAFARLVEARGGRLLAPPGGTPAVLSIELGGFGTGQLFAMAVTAGAVVLELRPIAGAFA